ncbi:MAG: polysaccharide biosynthesis/export family protein [Verrucomicrobiota bacterium]
MSGLAEDETLLKPGQSVTIRVAGVLSEEAAAINGPYAISDSGMIRLHLLDPITASGLTPSALSKHIEETYKRALLLTKPTIEIRTSNADPEKAHTVSVLGGVQSQSTVPLNPNWTILDAITECGGFSAWSDRNKVILIRNGERTIHDLSKTTAKENVLLKPGDTIIVRKRCELAAGSRTSG